LNYSGMMKKIVDTYNYLTGNLDTKTSLLMKTSEGLLRTTWTDAKAAYLDGGIKAGYPLELHTVTLTSGSSWTVPSDLIGDMVYVSGCGGGGGGGGMDTSGNYYGSGGSGAASLIMMPYFLNGAGSVSYAIGSGGAGGTTGANAYSGGNGGATTFGSIRIQRGFGGYSNPSAASTYYTYSPLRYIQGVGDSNPSDTSAGTTTRSNAIPLLNANPFIDGGCGGPGNFSLSTAVGVCPFASTSVSAVRGRGGNTLFGDGGSSNGVTPSGYGGGGKGSSSSSSNGANGANGVLYISYFRKVTS